LVVALEVAVLVGMEVLVAAGWVVAAIPVGAALEVARLGIPAEPVAGREVLVLVA
jgi:hypothetical protein